MVSLAGASRPPVQPPLDVPALLRRLLDDDPGRPRLTWYGPAGERVELSAKVLDNWVAKTANLLVDELDAGPGSRVAIVLPAHWRTACWLLAVWSVGGCATVGVGTGGADVLVTADPAVLAAASRAAASPAGASQAAAARAAAAVTAVAVALPALATSFGPDLPDGAVDAAIEVRAHGDVFVPFVRPAPGDPALETAGGLLLNHGELLPAAARAADDNRLGPRVRLLTGTGPDQCVRTLLAPLIRLGSVVLHHDLAGLDDDTLAGLRSQEGITAQL